MNKFSEILGNPEVLSVFLTIASHERMYDYEIAKSLNSSIENIQSSLNELEGALLIEKNPNKESRRFKLAFSGKLFATQLKSSYPEIKKLMGKKRIIEVISL